MTQYSINQPFDERAQHMVYLHKEKGYCISAIASLFCVSSDLVIRAIQSASKTA